jgi:hypothetical protein
VAGIKIILTDAADNDLNDNVTIELFSTHTSNQYKARTRVVREVVVNGMDISGGRTYRVRVSPDNHRVIQFFAMLNESSPVRHEEKVPVEPAKVVSIKGPAYNALTPRARDILATTESPQFKDASGSFLKGGSLYSALDEFPLLKACLLNIIAKSAAVGLQDEKTCLDHYLGLVQVHQDRLFIRTTAALVEEAAQSNAFHQVSAALHEPLPGYEMVSSFKSRDHYGNLQLTFQRRGEAGGDYIADVDIDDAQGIEHAFQVIRNTVAGPTNPYDIREILLQQNPPVDAGYQFLFSAAAGAARAKSRMRTKRSAPRTRAQVPERRRHRV